MKKDKIALLKEAQKGSSLALSRLLSYVEEDLLGALSFLARQKVVKKAKRLGITGPPGAGKSSLVNVIIQKLREKNMSVAVLAVDPSSPFSGGALLGDRVRMSDHAADPAVFIRSVGSRGGFGGLSAASGAMARVFELCGYDIVLIETVGVGQSELEIMNLVDLTTVVLVPESGDVIQTLKAGILEIADIFVINKADRPGAEALAQELRSLVEQETKGKERGIFLTSVPEKRGMEEYIHHMLSLLKTRSLDDSRIIQRARGELRHLLLFREDKKIRKKITKINSRDAFQAFLKFK